MRDSRWAGSREDEPEPPDGRPTCPSWVDAKAKAAWRLLIPQLDEMGVLGKCDRNTLTRYVVLFQEWREAVEYGDNPLSIKLSDHLLKIEREFGLTPSARAGLAKTKESKPTEQRGKGRFFARGSA